ncbi:MAG: metallophosphoesterase [Candidatus Omnitrophota bacterium]
MNRLPALILFVTIVASIYFGMHYFVFKCLTRQLIHDPTHQRILKWFFWFSGLSFFFITAFNSFYKLRILSYYSGVWLGIISISLFIFFIQWILARFILISPGYNQALAFIALIAIGVISIVSLINGNRLPLVRHLTIPIESLPPQMSGVTIVQLSDLHVETFSNPARLTETVNRTNALHPDLIVITGDLLDGNLLKNPEFKRQLTRLNATYGKVAITGNHEYYGGPDTFYELAAQSGIKVLTNEAITIRDTIQVVGLDDDEGKRFRGRGPHLEQAISTCDPKKPIVLLYHRPLKFDRAVAHGVDLQLSGHTHAGQIPPMDLIVWLAYKYPVGLYRKNKAYIYTSPGTYVWRTPMRFLSHNEITHITLVSK